MDFIYYLCAQIAFFDLLKHPQNQKAGFQDNNVYIQSATLNGQPLTKNYITYEDIMRGGTLTFQMGPTPNRQRNTAKSSAPFSLSAPN